MNELVLIKHEGCESGYWKRLYEVFDGKRTVTFWKCTKCGKRKSSECLNKSAKNL